MSALTLQFNAALEGPIQCNQARKRNERHTHQEKKIKIIPTYTHHNEKQKEATRNQQEYVGGFSKVRDIHYMFIYQQGAGAN